MRTTTLVSAYGKFCAAAGSYGSFSDSEAKTMAERYDRGRDVVLKHIRARLSICRMLYVESRYGGVYGEWYCETHDRTIVAPERQQVTHCGGGI